MKDWILTPELFEELLQQHEPFLDAWAELGYDKEEEEEIGHDQREGEAEE